MDREIKWGILGCGRIAHLFAQGLGVLNNAVLYAVASKTAGRAENFAKSYNALVYYDNYEELVKNPEVDVIYIATTHNFHYENAMLCLNHGKHVLCEKAFTINARQAEQLVKTAREKRLFLMEAMWTRFFPCIKELNRLLDKGTIGEIQMLRADFGFSRGLDPKERKMNPYLGGGALLDLGIYPISYARMIFKKAPSKIYSSAWLGETGVDQQSAYLFEYSSGQQALLFSSFISEVPHEAMIVGTKGHIKLQDFFHPSSMTIKMNDGKEWTVEKEYESTGYNYEAQEVMDCIVNGKLESDIMPLDETVEIMETMDEMRAQWGIVYPGE
jgi:predicted dehydrogenase